MNSLKSFWVGFKDIKGQTSRKDFWIGNIGNAAILFGIYYGLSYLIDYVGWYFYVDLNLIDTLIWGLYWLLFILYFIPALCSCLRRLRDAGFSPWVILIGLIPMMRIVLLILYCFKTKGSTVNDQLTSV
ncbi:DUF805 domain-containing protein [Enterococcus raffinosus]|uniref:DUF805 domain-containing protein n=1 Tax=Enterococcus raffinosus TaxID=71452 RepID=UPI001C1292A4|nr:DUF805 domain-containing protein [Enterococcus raffinosus]MBU5363425.1 DUF805 domain-containing protein [Enterococcus raffinosus]